MDFWGGSTLGLALGFRLGLALGLTLRFKVFMLLKGLKIVLKIEPQVQHSYHI